MIAPLPGWRAALGALAAAAAQDRFDATAWALTTGEGLILFDAGAGVAPVAARLRASLPGGALPRCLILTHGHADHSGGAAELQREGVQVWAGAATAGWIGAPDLAALSLEGAMAAGVYPPGYAFQPCRVDRILAPGPVLDQPGLRIEAIETPGHSADHLAYLVTTPGRRVLVGGDALFEGGTVILQDTWDSSVAQTCATIRRIAALAPDAILPGHGPALIGPAARAAIDAAMARVSRLLPPALYL